jgi:hypothetical protein
MRKEERIEAYKKQYNAFVAKYGDSWEALLKRASEHDVSSKIDFDDLALRTHIMREFYERAWDWLVWWLDQHPRVQVDAESFLGCFMGAIDCDEDDPAGLLEDQAPQHDALLPLGA